MNRVSTHFLGLIFLLSAVGCSTPPEKALINQMKEISGILEANKDDCAKAGAAFDVWIAKNMTKTEGYVKAVLALKEEEKAKVQTYLQSETKTMNASLGAIGRKCSSNKRFNDANLRWKGIFKGK